MDERLFEIESNISGHWENENYSFILKINPDGTSNTISFTDKNLYPNTGSNGVFYLLKENHQYIMRTVFMNGGTTGISLSYAIEYFDWLENKMLISHNGVTINLKRI